MINKKGSEDIAKINTGLRTPEVKPTDYIAGVASAITYEVRNALGNWEQYMTTPEKQYREGRFDTQSCTNFDTLKVVQGQINFLLKNKMIPEDKRVLMSSLGYMDDDGMVNFSEAFNAITSGTTSQGNFLQNPPQAIRDFGLIPQKDFITPDDVENFDQWIDKSRITPAMYDKAKVFNTIFDVSYEWILYGSEDHQALLTHIKQAPISIALGICGGWENNAPVKACSNRVAHHAVSLIGVDGQLYKRISDQYVPFVKTLDPDYYIIWALKIVVSVKKPKDTSKPKFAWTRVLKFGVSGYDVKQLQDKLAIEGFFKYYKSTGYFGTVTLKAVKEYQKAHNLVADGIVGKMTMAELNK